MPAPRRRQRFASTLTAICLASFAAHADAPQWFGMYADSGAIAWQDSPRYPPLTELLREQQSIAGAVQICRHEQEIRWQARMALMRRYPIRHSVPSAQQQFSMRIAVVFNRNTGRVIYPRIDQASSASRCMNAAVNAMRVSPFAVSEPVGVWFPLEGTTW